VLGCLSIGLSCFCIQLEMGNWIIWIGMRTHCGAHQRPRTAMQPAECTHFGSNLERGR
jgi:hypothetical protein